MANVLAVGMLIGQWRPASRSFLLGFESFGALALALFIALACCLTREVVIPFLGQLLAPIKMLIGRDRPVVLIPVGGFLALVILGVPQVAFALIGGFFSRRFKITITPG
jgi:hypothetical protein